MRLKAAIVLARNDSKRFPGKAMFRINGKPLLEHCLLPIVNNSTFMTILATTDRPIDDSLINLADKLGVKTFRGDCDNIAKRVKDCIEHFNIDYFARINGDSPFLQVELLEVGFKIIEEENLDFVTNLVPRSFPYGISLEILDAGVFVANFDQLSNAHYKEHITSFFYEHIEEFRIKTFVNNKDLSTVRLTIDEPQDVGVVEHILSKSADPKNPMASIIELYHDFYKTHCNS